MYDENGIFIMYDTCVFSFIMDGRLKRQNDKNDNSYIDAKQAISDLLMTDMCPLISDLTLVEIIIGCENIERLNKYKTDMNDCKFFIISSNENVENIITKIRKNDLSVEEFEDIKLELLEYKIDMLRDSFSSVLQKYCFLFYLTLFFNHKKWRALYLAFIRFINDNKKSWVEITGDYFRELIKTDKEKDMLFPFAVDFIYCLNIIYNLQYKKDDISVLSTSLNSNRFLKLSKKTFENFMKEYPASEENESINKTKCFMSGINKQLGSLNIDSNAINIIKNDAENYVIGLEIFEGKLFELNDLVDFYNISFLNNIKKNVKYHTSDKKWKIFFDYEKQINKEFQIYNSTIDDELSVIYKIYG